MIIGISHIVFGSSGIETDATFFHKYGYQIEFVENSHPTHFNKKKFMKSTSPSQEIAFLRKNNCISIELINYNISPSDSFSPLHIVLSKKNSDFVNEDNQKEKIKISLGIEGLRHLIFMYVKKMSAYILFSLDSEENSRSTLLIFTKNIIISKEFWIDKIGFSLEREDTFSSGERWAKLIFRSPIPQWNADLILCENPIIDTVNYLDDSGFRCLSVLTTNLKQEIGQKFNGTTIDRTGIMELRVNNKPLRAEIIRSPEGIYIEFLQLDLSLIEK